MKDNRLQSLVNSDNYQVFLLGCPAQAPLTFAIHPWFVVNKKGIISRWGISHKENIAGKEHWGHLYKDVYPPFKGTPIFPFSNTAIWKPRLFGFIEGSEGSEAESMAQYIESSKDTYPFLHTYNILGPNSNTYITWTLTHFSKNSMKLPWNAFGKNFAKINR